MNDGLALANANTLAIRHTLVTQNPGRDVEGGWPGVELLAYAPQPPDLPQALHLSDDALAAEGRTDRLAILVVSAILGVFIGHAWFRNDAKEEQ